MIWWIVAIAAIVLVTAAVLAYAMAHRLDRLHIRCDLAALSLDQALRRRHSVAVAVAQQLDASNTQVATQLRTAIDVARDRLPERFVGGTPQQGVELAENRLTHILDTTSKEELPQVLRAELVDACDRMAMAHRFYNDAVRDTRRLRELTAVRIFRLAGNAPLPEYIELSNPSYN